MKEYIDERLMSGAEDVIDEIVTHLLSNISSINDYVCLRIFLSCKQERDKGWPVPLYRQFLSCDLLVSIFMRIKLLLRRIEFGLDERYVREVFVFIERTWISPYLLFDIMHVNMVDEVYMKREFAYLFMRLSSDDEYRDSFINHAREVEYYDIEI